MTLRRLFGGAVLAKRLHAGTATPLTLTVVTPER